MTSVRGVRGGSPVRRVRPALSHTPTSIPGIAASVNEQSPTAEARSRAIEGGEMGARVREHDCLGRTRRDRNVETEPETAAGTVLACDFPMVVLWGADLIQIYNDAYRVLMGQKHPTGLGQPTAECWPEVWHINEPIYGRVFAGETVTFQDGSFRSTRFGMLEDAYFTLCYSPIPDEARRGRGRAGHRFSRRPRGAGRAGSKPTEAHRGGAARERGAIAGSWSKRLVSAPGIWT